MKIMDEHGRIGNIVERREGGFFARPDGTPEIIEDTDGVTGTPRARLLTATWWTRQPVAPGETDCIYTGLWYDSPLGTRLTCHKL